MKDRLEEVRVYEASSDEVRPDEVRPKEDSPRWRSASKRFGTIEGSSFLHAFQTSTPCPRSLRCSGSAISFGPVRTRTDGVRPTLKRPARTLGLKTRGEAGAACNALRVSAGRSIRA